MEADVTVQFTLKFGSHSSVEWGEKKTTSNALGNICFHLFGTRRSSNVTDEEQS